MFSGNKRIHCLKFQYVDCFWFAPCGTGPSYTPQLYLQVIVIVLVVWKVLCPISIFPVHGYLIETEHNLRQLRRPDSYGIWKPALRGRNLMQGKVNQVPSFLSVCVECRV